MGVVAGVMEVQMKRSLYAGAAVRVSRALLVGSIVAALGAGCSGGSKSGQGYMPTAPINGGSNGGNGSLSVSVVNNSYTPASTTVPRGSVVQWTWKTCDMGYGAETCTAHTVTFDDGATSDQQEKGTYSRSFPNAGTFAYHCKVHGTAMSGTIVVQ